VSKASLSFNLNDPDDVEQFRRAVNANAAHIALWEISQQVFRPARKHGYADALLRTLFDKNPDYAAELIGLLETRFYEIVNQAGLDI
jgi:hypothetical protein